MEEDIKILENIIYNDEGKKMSYVDVNYAEGEEFINAVVNLIARYKELDKKNNDLLLKLEMKKMLFVRQDKTTKELLTELYIRKDEIEKDYIPKSKVKEKIDDLNIKMAEQLKIISDLFGEHEKNRAKLTIYKEQRDILIELLED